MAEHPRGHRSSVRWRASHVMRACTIILAGAVLVTGCGDSSSDSEPVATTQPPVTDVPTEPTTLPTPEPTPTPSADWDRDDLLVSVEWVSREGEESLAIDPTDRVRQGGPAELGAAWDLIVAEFPEAGTDGMRMQFECHWIGAKGKDTWFIEPWRPDVTVAEMLRARCNPER